MNAKAKIAVVTGANRGIGYEIVRQLARRGTNVILTAKRSESGQSAREKLKAENLAVTFHPLEVTDKESIGRLRDFLASEFGRVDILINNAGKLDDADKEALSVDEEVVRSTLETNTLAPFRLIQVLTPLLCKSEAGRIINVSSGMGALLDLASDHPAYRLSKAALNAVTLIFANALKAEGLAVNAVCPGWVKTDMGGPSAPRDVSLGADTPVWLALDAPQSLTGKFLRDRKPIDW